jgi:L-rhamnose mutarotase
VKTKRICLACDLKDDPLLIEEYKRYHKKENAWPEIMSSISDSGIEDMQIFLTGNRLFMIMEVNETFDPEIKSRMDSENPIVQKWENLMSTFQQLLPWAEGKKWVEMENIFQLKGE